LKKLLVEKEPTQIKGMPNFLANPNLKLIMFGGKGGTGKTTCAATTALYLAKNHPEKRIIVISTDPAHSLGDSFDITIGARKTFIGGPSSNLWALEIDPKTELKDFKRKHEWEIQNLAERSGFYGQTSLDEFLSFSLPGMDELMIFLQIADMFKCGYVGTTSWVGTQFRFPKADLVILDTAPTGHTLRLLSLPQRMDGWLDVFDTSQRRYRTSPRVPFASARVRKPKPGGDFADDFVRDLRKDLATTSSLLENAQECQFVPVMIPEPMSIKETQDLLSALKEMQIPVRDIIVNHIQQGGECPFCSLRRSEQKEALSKIERIFGKYNLIRVPVFPNEVRQEKRLTAFARILSGKAYQPRPAKSTGIMPQQQYSATSNISALLQKELKFILFGGKGGVGKTSISAATALYMARCYPDKKVLVYSIDPAHSLADSFDFPIGNRVTPIPGVDNLYALETNAAKLHRDFIEGIRKLIQDAFDLWDSHLSSTGSLRWDRPVMSSFAEASPPGLDEVLALEQLREFVEKEEYDLYILDTAPTGHLLTLLQFPELIRDWLSYDYSKLLKWHVKLPLTEVTDIKNQILRSTTLLKKLRQILTDSEKSQLVAVTIPEAMAIAETEDLLFSIEKLEIPCRHIIINKVVPPTQCSFCLPKREEQLEYVEQVKCMNGYLATEIPLLPHEISGKEDLTKFCDIIYGARTERGRSSKGA